MRAFLTLELGGTGGNLSYNGAGETTAKVLNLAGTTGTNAIILANEAGATGLVFSSNIAAPARVPDVRPRWQQSYRHDQRDPGVIQDSSAPTTSLTKIGSNTWLYDPAVANYAAAVSTTVTTGAINQNQLVLNDVTVSPWARSSRPAARACPPAWLSPVLIPSPRPLRSAATLVLRRLPAVLRLPSEPSALDSPAVSPRWRHAADASDRCLRQRFHLISDAATGTLTFGTDAVTGNGFAGGMFQYQYVTAVRKSSVAR